MKRYLFQGMLLGCILALAIPAWSYTVAEVGSLDTILASTKLPNSGEQTELDWVALALGVDVSTLTFTDKYDTASGWQLVTDSGSTSVFAHALTTNPEYFLIKTGNVTADDTVRDWLFRNNIELSFAVINLEAMGFENIINVGGISHIDEFNGTRVPEAGALLMFGSGLIGLVGYRRLRRMQ